MGKQDDTSLGLILVLAYLLESTYGLCNQKFPVLVNEVTYITSPNYPGNFTGHVDCYYELYVAAQNPGLVIFLDVLDVTLDCLDEGAQLRVFSDFSRTSRPLGRICEGGQTTFSSPKQSLYLTFRSRVPHEGRSRGFKLRIRSEPRFTHCYTKDTVVKEVTSLPAVLTTPYYPHAAAANVQCRWLLKAPIQSRINVTVLDADMRGSHDCHNFAFYIYDGKTTYDDSLMTSVCDNGGERRFESSGPYLLVIFTSGPMIYNSGGGVSLQYSAIPDDEPQELAMVNQTLFFVITALLVVLITALVVTAIFKLFLLPSRRKQAERRRRESRARLTRLTSRESSQSESSTPEDSRVDSQSGPFSLGHDQSGPFSISHSPAVPFSLGYRLSHSRSAPDAVRGCFQQPDILTPINRRHSQQQQLAGDSQFQPGRSRSEGNGTRLSLHGSISLGHLSREDNSALSRTSRSFFSRLLTLSGLETSRRGSSRHSSPLEGQGRCEGQRSEEIAMVTHGPYYANQAFLGDHPPSYDEAVRQGALWEDTLRCLHYGEVAFDTPENAASITRADSLHANAAAEGVNVGEAEHDRNADDSTTSPFPCADQRGLPVTENTAPSAVQAEPAIGEIVASAVHEPSPAVPSSADVNAAELVLAANGLLRCIQFAENSRAEYDVKVAVNGFQCLQSSESDQAKDDVTDTARSARSSESVLDKEPENVHCLQVCWSENVTATV